MTITKNITAAVASVAILLSASFPAFADASRQGFVHDQRSNEISACENRRGYYWSGSFENGQCIREGSAKKSEGNGLLNAIVWTVVIAGTCAAFDCHK